VLRPRRRKADRLVADGGPLLRLPFEGPPEWPAILAHLGAHATPEVEQVSDGIYRRTITVGGDPGVLELSLGTTSSHPAATLSVTGQPSAPAGDNVAPS
jgi:AraC family transcriptional regulator of adaptative response / DNA-3-methyladenine glycosylase II